jgi:hypothetical protein
MTLSAIAIAYAPVTRDRLGRFLAVGLGIRLGGPNADDRAVLRRNHAGLARHDARVAHAAEPR